VPATQDAAHDSPVVALAPLATPSSEPVPVAAVGVGDLAGEDGDPSPSGRALDPPKPVPGIGDGMLLDQLPDEAIEAIVETAVPPLITLEIRQLGGPMALPSAGHGAVGSLDARYAVFAAGLAMTDEIGAAVGAAASPVLPRPHSEDEPRIVESCLRLIRLRPLDVVGSWCLADCSEGVPMHRMRDALTRDDQRAVAATEAGGAAECRVGEPFEGGQDFASEVARVRSNGVVLVPCERGGSLAADAVAARLGYAASGGPVRCDRLDRAVWGRRWRSKGPGDPRLCVIDDQEQRRYRLHKLCQAQAGGAERIGARPTRIVLV
jgi:hypothetical protein